MKNVLIIQSSLRGFFFNFGKYLTHHVFINVTKPGPDPRTQTPPSYFQEINRQKNSLLSKFRRVFGILNIRPFFYFSGSMVFTYGCLLLTNKPYCVCMENGLALFNYDPHIALHPAAKLILYTCLIDPHLKKLIFLSEAAKASFFSSVKLPTLVKNIISNKSEVCYPITGRQSLPLKRKYNTSVVKFLFVGYFYMKGGMELVNTVIKLNKKFSSKYEVYIVTQNKLMRDSDIQWVKTIPNIHLIEADLNSDQMNNLYSQCDAFIYPTYRDSFGLVLLEAISWGLPVICTNQFATKEMVIDNNTGFILNKHPMQDYDLKTYQIYGKYYQPNIFYHDLFLFQKLRKFKDVENFLYISMEKLINSPQMLLKMKNNTTAFYQNKFNYHLSSAKIEMIFDQTDLSH